MMCQMTDDSGTGWARFPDADAPDRGAEYRPDRVFDMVLKTFVGRPIQAQVTADTRDSRSYKGPGRVRNAAGQHRPAGLSPDGGQGRRPGADHHDGAGL